MAKYSGYSIDWRIHPWRSVEIGPDMWDSNRSRFYFQLARIPSAKKLIVRTFIGATDSDVADALYRAERVRAVGIQAILPGVTDAEVWRRFRRKDGTYWFRSPLLGKRVSEADMFEHLTADIAVPEPVDALDHELAELLGGVR